MINRAVLAIALLALIAAAYIFFAEHLPAVGWGYVRENWVSYLLVSTAFVALIALFWSFAKFLEMAANCAEGRQ